MRKQNHKHRNRLRLSQAKVRKRAALRDDDVFTDDDHLFFAIDSALENPDTNSIIVQDKNKSGLVVLRGPNVRSKNIFQMICSRSSQLAAVEERYCLHIMNPIEAEGRIDRSSGKYGIEPLKKVGFTSRKEWVNAWSTSDRQFIMPEEKFQFYMSKEVWANEEYWALLDKKCDIGTRTSLLNYPLWHLCIRRRDEKPLHDWRVLQAIKNHVVGEEYEGIELYPADSRIMDVGNVYHLWILAPNDGETDPPRFPFGAKNPEQGGAIQVRDTVMILTERTKRAYETGEMSPEERNALRKLATRADMLIFPDALLPEAEAMFPGEERVAVMQKYATQHPELAMEEWNPGM